MKKIELSMDKKGLPLMEEFAEKMRVKTFVSVEFLEQEKGRSEAPRTEARVEFYVSDEEAAKIAMAARESFRGAGRSAVMKVLNVDEIVFVRDGLMPSEKRERGGRCTGRTK